MSMADEWRDLSPAQQRALTDAVGSEPVDDEQRVVCRRPETYQVLAERGLIDAWHDLTPIGRDLAEWASSQ